MINHLRNLIVNMPSSNREVGYLGEEYIPPEFDPLTLDGPLQSFRSMLFGTKSDRFTVNYITAEVLKILNQNGFQQYLNKFGHKNIYKLDRFRENATNYEIAQVEGEVDFKLTSGPDALPGHYLFDVSIDSNYRMKVIDKGEAAYDDDLLTVSNVFYSQDFYSTDYYNEFFGTSSENKSKQYTIFPLNKYPNIKLGVYDIKNLPARYKISLTKRPDQPLKGTIDKIKSSPNIVRKMANPNNSELSDLLNGFDNAKSTYDKLAFALLIYIYRMEELRLDQS